MPSFLLKKLDIYIDQYFLSRKNYNQKALNLLLYNRLNNKYLY